MYGARFFGKWWWWNFCFIEQQQRELSLSSQKIFDANEGCMIYADFMMYDIHGTNISLPKTLLKMNFLFPRWDMLVPWRISISTDTPVSHDTTKFVVSKRVMATKLGWSSYPQFFLHKSLGAKGHQTTSNNLPPTTIRKIHQGKIRWHRYHVLVYLSPILTYLLGTVPCTLTMV